MSANRVEIIVPLLPPSVNHYKNPRSGGGYFRTPAAKAFSDAVYYFSRQAPQLAGKFYSVELEFSIARERFLRCDADNLEKVAFDALTNARIISDDRYIVRHTNVKRMVANRFEEQTKFVVEGIEA